MSSHPILIADIGGTNARFALANDAPSYFSQEQTLKAADFEQLVDAIDAYLSSLDIAQLQGICLAVAGPVKNDSVVFPNNHWSVNCPNLREKYNITQTSLLNDWEAISYSLSVLNPSDLQEIGGQWTSLADQDYTVAALGPGSGLGISGLLRRKQSLTPLITEGGHSGFSPENNIQMEILRYLHGKYDTRISIERILSGPGIVNIHKALCAINNTESQELTATEIATAGINKGDVLCVQTIDLFFEILGQVAGDIALTIGANQGVFIGGGIAQRYPDSLAKSRFRQGFENKGRHSELMKGIPTWLIKHRNPGLLGASVYCRSRL